ncbi:MAG: sugar phosphate isomerase/epimerase, partial [Deltaproteobacteria bacterium]|nr:sugar phosphate isomerase/epimerase [Deltaproteobacteria bacterium]
HAYAWCSEWTNDALDLIDKVKNLGMDFIELPMLSLETFDTQAIKTRLGEVGLEAVTSTVLLKETDISSEDPRTRDNGVDYLKACVQATRDIGARNFSGVIYSEFVKPPDAPRPDGQTWRRVADCLADVARFAKSLGVRIGLEPVNRYETNLINTCEQALRLIEMIGEDNVGIHLDTYHMNIEEKSFYKATKCAGDFLMHYHFCENDRGIPGTGLVNWDDIFRALAEMNYQGYAAMESFVGCTDNMSSWVWRELAPSGDILLKEGTKFIRGMQRKYGLRKTKSDGIKIIVSNDTASKRQFGARLASDFEK